MYSFDPDKVNIPQANFINGRYVDNVSFEVNVLRPSDGKSYASFHEADAELVDYAVNIAEEQRLKSGWSTCSPRQRAKILFRWADLIEKDAEYLGQLEALGSTRPIKDVIAHEIPFTAEAIRFFAECADKYSGDVLPTKTDSLGLIVPEPYGVIAAITPWNFPLSMASWKCGAALAAGNAVVLKPSELTPFSSARLAELAIHAGMPPGVLNVIQGRGHITGSALTKHNQIRKVSFTGSTLTGSKVMCDAAMSGMKPVTLELGGKSPQLVYNDAGDIDEVAERIYLGFATNSGQACVSGSRLIVQEGIADALIEKLIHLCKQPEPGYTWNGNTGYCPLIDGRQGEKVSGIVKQSLLQGGQLLAGGNRFDDTADGWYWQPTLIDHVTSENVAVKEEIFGPVLTIQRFSSDDEGLALASHETFGLCAGVHTQNISRALTATRSLNAGTVWVNRYRRTWDFIIPTGGFQGSGFGKELGRQAFTASHREKSVLIDF